MKEDRTHGRWREKGVILEKKKKEIFKKVEELYELCDVDVALIIIGSTRQLFKYACMLALGQVRMFDIYFNRLV